MKPINFEMTANFVIQESKNMESAINRITRITDANYEKANLKDITHLLKHLYSGIYRLLKKNETCFMAH